MTCDCDDDYCEHWQERERRFKARTATLVGPPRPHCPECYRLATMCECES